MGNNIFRRNLVAGVMLAGLFPQAAFSESGRPASVEAITVYKSPTCTCCDRWVSHLEDNGFRVNTIHRSDMSGVKSIAGVPHRLAACHTGLVGGYVVEGHVPANDIKRLLRERPAVTGLSVPGMPVGSPGMEGKRYDRYKVLTFDKTGDTTVFKRY